MEPTTETPVRTLETIEKEHQEACANAGFLNYRLRCGMQEIEALYKKISDLNQEAIQQATEAPKPEVVA